MDDLISRQAAIDALTEYGNGRAVYISAEEAVRRIEQLPSAQPDHIADDSKKASYSCGHENDTISRQAAIEVVAEFLYYTSNFDGMRQGFDLSDWKWKMEGVLSDLPSAQPEPGEDEDDAERQEE